MNETDETMVQVIDFRMCAGLVIRGGIVVETAPILRHYRGLSEARARELVRQKNMEWRIME